MNSHEITVKNSAKTPDTKATIIHEANINFIPKVSVIMPVYNTEKYLRETLETLVNQSLIDIELICIDDGSTDSSLEILKEFASKDNRFTIITQKNLYAGIARNAGFSVARGEYLSFLDSDDLFKKNMLEILYENAKSSQAEVVICNYTTCSTSDNLTSILSKNVKESHLAFDFEKNNSLFSPQEKAKDLFQISAPMPWNKLYKRELLTQNNIYHQNLARAEDVYVSLITLTLAKKIKVIDNVLIYFRTGINNSSMSKLEKNPLCFYDAYLQVHKDLVKNGLFETFQVAFLNDLIRTTLWTLAHLEKSGDLLRSFILNTIIPSYNIFGRNKILVDEHYIKRLQIILDNTKNIIITLLSSPEKIENIHKIIESLFYQTKKVNKIFLWLDLNKFPHKIDMLPQNLKKLIPLGLTVEFYENIQTYKGFIYALSTDPKNLIIEAEDIEIYEKKWLEYHIYNEFVKI